ncbi:hypothetical protein BJY01DRAFT_141269 [Aspergillus pseudoustus]|uniref:Uncharacterized protein n=1 Tax=Aspergillus pseudoustus TaxID=1810923 RepID=A0ABR4IGS4_9EURO
MDLWIAGGEGPHHVKTSRDAIALGQPIPLCAAGATRDKQVGLRPPRIVRRSFSACLRFSELGQIARFQPASQTSDLWDLAEVSAIIFRWEAINQSLLCFAFGDGTIAIPLMMMPLDSFGGCWQRRPAPLGVADQQQVAAAREQQAKRVRILYINDDAGMMDHEDRITFPSMQSVLPEAGRAPSQKVKQNQEKKGCTAQHSPKVQEQKTKSIHQQTANRHQASPPPSSKSMSV